MTDARQDVLNAIARARIADKRMLLAESLADETGMQIAYQAVLHNLYVIADGVRTMPAELLAQDPETPWSDVAAMPELIQPNYQVIPTADMHHTVLEVLDPLEAAVRRLGATR